MPRGWRRWPDGQTSSPVRKRATWLAHVRVSDPMLHIPRLMPVGALLARQTTVAHCVPRGGDAPTAPAILRRGCGALARRTIVLSLVWQLMHVCDGCWPDEQTSCHLSPEADADCPRLSSSGLARSQTNNCSMHYRKAATWLAVGGFRTSTMRLSPELVLGCLEAIYPLEAGLALAVNRQTSYAPVPRS
jgi:hypothetical protein